jgi:hypothetical protein
LAAKSGQELGILAYCKVPNSKQALKILNKKFKMLMPMLLSRRYLLKNGARNMQSVIIVERRAIFVPTARSSGLMLPLGKSS